MNWLMNRWWVTQLMNQFGAKVAVLVLYCVWLLGVAFPGIRLGDVSHTLMDSFGNFIVLTTVAQGAVWLWRRHRSPG